VEKVLASIKQYQESIKKDSQWSTSEKSELLAFLRAQTDAWGMLGDTGKGSQKLREAKERMLLSTWSNFTAGMKARGSKAGLEKVEGGLEQEPSTSGSVVQGDIKVISEGVETPVSEHTPVGQTIAHKSGSKGKKADQSKLTQ